MAGSQAVKLGLPPLSQSPPSAPGSPEPEGWKEPGPVAAPGVCSASRLSAAGGEAASRTDVVPATRQPCVALLALPAFPSCFILYEQPVPATVSCTFLSPESELCFQS